MVAIVIIVINHQWEPGFIDRECRQHNHVINLQHTVIDFEMAMINSVEQVFGNQVTKQGCLFHESEYVAENSGSWTSANFQHRSGFPSLCCHDRRISILASKRRDPGHGTFASECPPTSTRMELLQYFDTNYVNGAWRNIQGPWSAYCCMKHTTDFSSCAVECPHRDTE